MRVVSLLASATEMIAELGCLDQLTGRSHECDYPPAVLDLPLVSSALIDANASSSQIDAQVKQLAQARDDQHAQALKALSIYAIDLKLLQELQPDLIFTQTQCEVCAVSERDVLAALTQLTGLDPRVVSLSPYRLADVWEDLLRVGSALQREEQARILVEGYQARLERLQEETLKLKGAQARPRVTVLEWLDPLMGAGNWTPELVAYAGADHVFGETGMHSPWISWSELQESDPEILVLSPCGFSLARTLAELPLLQKHPAWQSLRAVKDERVYAIDGNYYLNRSGPRLVESAEILGHIIWGSHPPVVEEMAWTQISSEVYPAHVRGTSWQNG